MNAHNSDIIYRIAAAAFSNATACPECVDVLVEARDEIERLRLAIRKIAEQDATLSVCEGNVTVTMDATLTDAERQAVEYFAWGGTDKPLRSTPLPELRHRDSLRRLLNWTK